MTRLMRKGVSARTILQQVLAKLLLVVVVVVGYDVVVRMLWSLTKRDNHQKVDLPTPRFFQMDSSAIDCSYCAATTKAKHGITTASLRS